MRKEGLYNGSETHVQYNTKGHIKYQQTQLWRWKMQTVWLKYLKLKCVISAPTNVIANVFKQVSKILSICHWTAKQKTPTQTQTIGCAQINKVPQCSHLDESTYEWFTCSCPSILCYVRTQYFIINILTHFNFKENKNNWTNKCLRCFKIACEIHRHTFPYTEYMYL